MNDSRRNNVLTTGTSSSNMTECQCQFNANDDDGNRGIQIGNHASTTAITSTITTAVDTAPTTTTKTSTMTMTMDYDTSSIIPHPVETQVIILFYKYHPLSNDKSHMGQYQQILHTLCTKLHLKGRILIGTSNREEGINGTLAGEYCNILSFTHALLYNTTNQIPQYEHDDDDDGGERQLLRKQAIETFWIESAQFFRNTIHQPELRMESPNDFKWSKVVTNSVNNTDDVSSNGDRLLFPDLHIKLVSELIGTGCTEFAQIPIDETSIGYLSPEKWHAHLVSLDNTKQKEQTNTTSTTNSSNPDTTISNASDDTIIIDCRNTKEYQIGHFTNAINPNTTTFAQFIPWVQNNSYQLENKTIYMYCTGGIRCEKASAYIRRTVPNTKHVYHLHGGIHKYLEQYGSTTTSSPPLTTTPTTTPEALNNHNRNEENTISNDNGCETTVTQTSAIWKGRNFVFDGRGAISSSSIIVADPSSSEKYCTNDDQYDTYTVTNDDNNNKINDNVPVATDAITKTMIVGQCAYCQSPYDQFDPHCVCTVCREPILICKICQITDRKKANDNNERVHPGIIEYHCSNHLHLQDCYYTNLCEFTISELQYQLLELIQHMATIAIGRRYKQKRKTLQKQIVRVQERISEVQMNLLSSTKTGESLKSTIGIIEDNDNPKNYDVPCRSCGSSDCVDGRCWGFYGLKRKQRLFELNNHTKQESNVSALSPDKDDNLSVVKLPVVQTAPHQKPSGHLTYNKRRKEDAIEELIQLKIAGSPAAYRDDVTSVRVPPCCTRIVQCTIKAKWCGQSILKVIQNEFVELAKTDVLKEVVSNGLLRLNGEPVSLNELTSISLKGSDTLGRIIHWHEAPVLVPMRIDIERFTVPSTILNAFDSDCDDMGTLFICNKPSSVPTHPAGPYLSNTLTMMVEGQEGLPTHSLYPLHRTDRVTSGLTLCSTSVAVSRAFHKSLTDGNVDKMYLAKVTGNFISSSAEVVYLTSQWKPKVGFCEWSDDGEFVIVDAPIYTSDPAAGVRTIDSLGKASKSIFKRLYYDTKSNTSVILCCPITGRNHQLRVHLLALGFPIVNDVQYGSQRDTQPLLFNFDNAAVDAMIRARDSTPEHEECRISSLRDDDVAAAKKACICCRSIGKEGILASFTKAQLLVEGHTICLHAYRYRIRITAPKSTKKAGNNNDCDSNSQLAEFDFQVRPPMWTDEKYLQNISWLKKQSIGS